MAALLCAPLGLVPLHPGTFDAWSSAERSLSPVASHWRGRRFVSFGHQGSGGFKAAPNGFSLFGLAVAKRHRAPRSFVSGHRYGLLSPLSFLDWRLRLSPPLGGLDETISEALLFASVGALPDRAIRLTLGARSPQLADAH